MRASDSTTRTESQRHSNKENGHTCHCHVAIIRFIEPNHTHNSPYDATSWKQFQSQHINWHPCNIDIVRTLFIYFHIVSSVRPLESGRRQEFDIRNGTLSIDSL